MTAEPMVRAPADAAAEALDEIEAAGWRVLRPSPDAFWEGHAELEEESQAFGGLFPDLENLRNREVILGFLGRSHLGDIICMSPLVRLLTVHRACRVFVVRHRGIYKVFENNPYLAGYRNEGRLSLTEIARGPGHLTQKLTRAFGLPLDPFPRGEIYLSESEQRWAWSVRASLPRNKPVAVVCAGSVSDNCVVPSGSLAWQSWVDILARRFTVVQVAVTRMACIEEVMRPNARHLAAWRPDTILDNCLVLENLEARRFFAVFSIASLFLGTNTGSAHVAAAFEVPAVLALGARQYPAPPRFPDRIQGNRWKHESFLYPDHSFILQ